jgi:hypothetical protein
MRITHDQAIRAIEILIHISDYAKVGGGLTLKDGRGRAGLLVLERPLIDQIVELSNEIENND